MPECRNINLQNKYMTFEMYIKTGLLVLKTEKNRVFSIVSHCASNETRRNMKQRNAYDMKKSYVIFVSLQLSFLKITKKKSVHISQYTNLKQDSNSFQYTAATYAYLNQNWLTYLMSML